MVRAGDTIQINIQTVGDSVKGVVLSVGLASEGLGSAKLKSESLEGPGPFSIPYKIPKNFIGKLYMSAEAFAAEDESYFGKTFVMVQPIAPIVSIAAPPFQHIELSFTGVGQQFLLSVYAQLSNGDEVSITSSDTGTTYSLLSERTGILLSDGNGTAVISVSPNGLVEALGPGQDTVLISNSGKTTAVIVTVMPHE